MSVEVVALVALALVALLIFVLVRSRPRRMVDVPRERSAREAAEPVPEPPEQTPARYTRLALGDVERPSAVIEPIEPLPETRLRPLSVGERKLEALQTVLRHAPKLAKNASTAASRTYALRFPPEVAAGIRSNSLRVMQSAEGGLRGVAVDAQGKIVSHATLVPASSARVAAVAAGVFQVLAIATAQYYLPQINRRLARIEQGIKEIQEHLESQDRAILTDSLRQLRSARDQLEEGDSEERDVLVALIGLDVIDRDSGRVQEAYRERMERYGRELDELKLSGFFVPDLEAASEKAAQHERAALVSLQAMYVRSVAAQLRAVAGGRMVQARRSLVGLGEDLKAWNEQRRTFHSRFEERVREDATAALDLDDLKEALGDEDTLANRRKNILNEARKRQYALISSYRELRRAVREATERTERQLSAASDPLTLVVEMNEQDEIERVYEEIA